MKITVTMPKVGDTVDEVDIVEWDATPGQRVAEGESLVRVETDKAIVEVPAPVAGILSEQLVEPGQDVRTGEPIAVIEADQGVT